MNLPLIILLINCLNIFFVICKRLRFAIKDFVSGIRIGLA